MKIRVFATVIGRILKRNFSNFKRRKREDQKTNQDISILPMIIKQNSISIYQGRGSLKKVVSKNYNCQWLCLS